MIRPGVFSRYESSSPPVRLDAAAAVVDDHVAMMVEDPNTRNEVPTGTGIQCRWTRTTTTKQCIIGNDMMGRAQDDDDDGRPHHSPSSSSSEGMTSSPAIIGRWSLKGAHGSVELEGAQGSVDLEGVHG